MTKENLIERITAVRNAKTSLILKNARVLNLFTHEILPCDVAIWKNMIRGLGNFTQANLPDYLPQEACPILDLHGAYLAPGLIDSHVHIESSMQVPAGFASVVIPCGTTSVIADPHEIANVSGVEGLRYFLDQAKNLPLHIYTMMPSCVPCTAFENNGCFLGAESMALFSDDAGIIGLGEVMNPTAVVACDSGMMDKILLYTENHKQIDGHSPGLSGTELAAYSVAGVQTDHECSSYQEIIERLRLGMKVMIRVGSAANDVDEMFREIVAHSLPTDRIFFCTDDKHTEDIRREGHINAILRRAVAAGIPAIDAVQMASLNPAIHYSLAHTGAVAPGYLADLVAFSDLKEFEVTQVIVGGKPVFDESGSIIFDFPSAKPAPEFMLHTVHCQALTKDKLAIHVPDAQLLHPVMELMPHQLTTKLDFCTLPAQKNLFVPEGNLAKIAVVERHKYTGNVGVGVIRGFGIRNGAIASTVAHDSHNIVVVGDNDQDILLAVTQLEQIGGGYVVTSHGKILGSLPLPIAGLITDAPVVATQDLQHELITAAHNLGIPDYYDPFISLSFLALPVIPAVRITDLGLFDVTASKILPL